MYIGEQWTDSSLQSPPAHSIPSEEQAPGQIVNAPKVVQLGLHQVQREVDTSQLRQQVKQMESKFEDLLNAASDDLERRKVPTRKISRSLFVRRASDTQTHIDRVAGHLHEIREADTVDHLFSVLSAGKCWDFLNPGLLNRIIDNHCTESVDAKKFEYLEKLRQFRIATKARDFAKVCNASILHPKHSEVVFEMGKTWDNATLEDVDNFKQKLQGQEFFDDLVSFKGSHSSSLSLVWTFPCSCSINTTILRIPPFFYLEHGIRRVLVKGVCVVDVKVTDSMGSCALSGMQHHPHSFTTVGGGAGGS